MRARFRRQPVRFAIAHAVPARSAGVAALAATVVAALLTSACGSASTPTGPSATTSAGSSSTAGTGTALSSIALSASSVSGQGQPTGTVRLAAAAPSSGAVVTLSTNRTDIARVPATVTIPAGSTSGTFTVDTSTVPAQTSVTITASYAGSTREIGLTITAGSLTAAFQVRSPSRGVDACVLGPGPDEADCVLDGSASSGGAYQYIWTYTVGTATLGHTSTDPATTMQLATKCAFFNDGRGGDDANGDRYVQLTVQLVVADRAGNRGSPVSRAVRFYPNRLCGFNY